MSSLDSVTSEEESFEEIDVSALSFEFRGTKVPVSVASTVTPGEAQIVLECKQFTNWVARCEKTYANKHLKMHGIEIQSVDPFGQRCVQNAAKHVAIIKGNISMCYLNLENAEMP